jgi:hypothetical protein
MVPDVNRCAREDTMGTRRNGLLIAGIILAATLAGCTSSMSGDKAMMSGDKTMMQGDGTKKDGMMEKK